MWVGIVTFAVAIGGIADPDAADDASAAGICVTVANEVAGGNWDRAACRWTDRPRRARWPSAFNHMTHDAQPLASGGQGAGAAARTSRTSGSARSPTRRNDAIISINQPGRHRVLEPARARRCSATRKREAIGQPMTRLVAGSLSRTSSATRSPGCYAGDERHGSARRVELSGAPQGRQRGAGRAVAVDLEGRRRRLLHRRHPRHHRAQAGGRGAAPARGAAAAGAEDGGRRPARRRRRARLQQPAHGDPRLRAICCSSELAARSTRAAADVEEIQKAGRQRAPALTRQLLAFSRKQVLQPRGARPQRASSRARRCCCAGCIGEDIELESELDRRPRAASRPIRASSSRCCMNLVGERARRDARRRAAHDRDGERRVRRRTPATATRPSAPGRTSCSR